MALYKKMLTGMHAKAMTFTCNNPRNCNFLVFEFFICLNFKTNVQYIVYIQCDVISTSTMTFVINQHKGIGLISTSLARRYKRLCDISAIVSIMCCVNYSESSKQRFEINIISVRSSKTRILGSPLFQYFSGKRGNLYQFTFRYRPLLRA